MAQVKLTLRPPPNVDFVHGYPGIPPGGPERPQAAVKGAIEVRCPQGVKAKWLRIELRKVETLPTGNLLSTFYDFVGPSPVNLWTSSDEYDLLRTQDFPFSIRIPESIPPSVMLENRAGIQYELVASLCTKGKKGFFRRRKSIVVSTQASIIIDKHELHSTWPVYNQLETRHAFASGCTLLVDRSQTCYGPGDRIACVATLRADGPLPDIVEGRHGGVGRVVLRGFEMILRETTIFHPGPGGIPSSSDSLGNSSRRIGGSLPSSSNSEVPKPRTISIADTKLALNEPLNTGAVHTAELVTVLSGNHTTTTLNAARHIDVTYILCVRAVLEGLDYASGRVGGGTGFSSGGDSNGGSGQGGGVKSVVLEMPVVISNWQRNVSDVAIRRIGPAPGLSLIPIPSGPSTSAPTSAASATFPSATRQNQHKRNNSANSTHGNGGAGFGQTLPSSSQIHTARNPSIATFSTMPVSATTTLKPTPMDEFGAFSQHPPGSAVSASGVGKGYGFGLGLKTSGSSTSMTTITKNLREKPGHKYSLSGGSISKGRISEDYQHSSSVGVGLRQTEGKPGAGAVGGGTAAGKRPGSSSARFTVMNPAQGDSEDMLGEDEKERAWRDAVGGGSLGDQGQGQIQQQQQQQWLSARDEKSLYEAARAKADRVQGYVTDPNAQLQNQAQSSIVPAAGSHSLQKSASPPQQQSDEYPGYHESAEDEKRRYERARAAALGTQGIQAYLNAGSGGTPDASPKPPSLSHVGITPEKKRGLEGPAILYNQAVAARDKVLSRQNSLSGGTSGVANVNSTNSTNNSPPLATVMRSTGAGETNVPHFLTAEQEKAALRRYEEAKMAVDRVQNSGVGDVDAGAGGSAQAGATPIAYERLYPGSSSSVSAAAVGVDQNHGGDDDLPPPFPFDGDGVGGSERPLSAYEEKERLRKAYEKQDAAASNAQTHTHGNTNAISSFSTEPAPTVQTSLNGIGLAPVITGAEQIKKAVSEKELLRRKLEAEDAAAVKASVGRKDVQRSVTVVPPSPQVTMSSPKAQTQVTGVGAGAGAGLVVGIGLKHVNGNGNGELGLGRSLSSSLLRKTSAAVLLESTAASTTTSTSAAIPPPAPPPLLPRPPAEYIQETREEDARVAMAMGTIWPSASITDNQYQQQPNRLAYQQQQTFNYYQPHQPQSYAQQQPWHSAYAVHVPSPLK